ncbi:Protein ApaG [Galdieria sulphuraria]|nr:Protein ApaG [Galdieria sulphuraria]
MDDGTEASQRSPEDVIRTLPPRLPEPERIKLWERIYLLRQERDLAAKEYRFEEASKLKERLLELTMQDPYACLELELRKAVEEERYRDAAIYSDAMRVIGEPPKIEKQDLQQRNAPRNRNIFGFIPKDWPTKTNTGAFNLRRSGIRDMTDDNPYKIGEVGALDQSEYLRLEGFDSNDWEDGHLSTITNKDPSTIEGKTDSKQKLFTYRELLQIQNKSDAVTMGIRVRVECSFSPFDSIIEEGMYTFVYYVEISNLSDDTVQLISREWDIEEITGVWKRVTGTGVVGQQPIIEPGETFKYSSKCPVRVPSFFNPSKDNFLGSMQGKYVFIRGEVGEQAFDVKIARFGFFVNVSL